MEYKDMQFPTRQDMRNEIARLNAEVADLQSLVPHPGDGTCEHCGSVPATEITLCEECRTDSGELGRWQEEVRRTVIDKSGAPDSIIDGGGSDGDALEFTLAEISQGFNYIDNLLFDTMESVSHSYVDTPTVKAAADLIVKLHAENEKLAQNVCDECDPENYGWVFNRVEGRGACTCMLEAEPFQILLKALERIAGPVGPQSGMVAEVVAKEALRAVLPLDYVESEDSQ